MSLVRFAQSLARKPSSRCFSTQIQTQLKKHDHLGLLTKTAKARKPSPIRKLIPLMQIPGIISLGGGLPSPDLFPIDGLSFHLKDGENITLSDEEMAEACQYSQSTGIPSILKHLEGFQQRTHSPSSERDGTWGIMMTTGSMDAITAVFNTTLEDGQSILVDNPSFPGTLSALQPRGCNLIGIDTDEFGVIPSHLKQLLDDYSGKPDRPKVMYTIPTGQNPSGSTLTMDRKKQIYEFACQNDILILEDDPYYFLNFGRDPAPENDGEYESPKATSFWSMDTEDRVIRFDSFSKILLPGLRLGFVTAPKHYIEKLNYHMQATSMHTSGISQAIVGKLLRHWGDEGFDEHVKKVQLFYKRRRDAAIQSANRHLSELAEWGVPEAGMFLWMKLNGIDDTKTLIEEKAIEAKVILVPGEAFTPDGSKSPFVRAAFSTVPEEKIDEAFSRLATLIKQHRNL